MTAVVLVLCLFPLIAEGADSIHYLTIPGDVRFGLVGEKRPEPSPTLFILGSSLEQSLQDPDNSGMGTILAGHGFLLVSVDLPSHGQKKRDDERPGLDGWRDRLERGEDLVGQFVGRASNVLNFLIDKGYTDPGHVAVCGISRGGFLALHFAAVDQRIRYAAAFAPVTDLLALREFAGMEYDARLRALALARLADKLTDCAIWITIGSTDHRVSTDLALQFARRIVEAAETKGKHPNLELHIMPTEGHRVHASAHPDAAQWLLNQMKLKSK